MKKTFRYFVACTIVIILFVGCTNYLFPNKLSYNVIDASQDANPVVLMSADFYKNDLNFYIEGRPVASFRLPPGPQPCDTVSRCHEFIFIADNSKYRIINSNRSIMELQAKNIENAFVVAITKTRNQQFKLINQKI